MTYDDIMISVEMWCVGAGAVSGVEAQSGLDRSSRSAQCLH